jgi:hypothetical protein
MTNADRARFAELLLALGETFDETMSDMRAEIYFRALMDLPLDVVERAIVDAARYSKFFPKPAELRTLIAGDPADLAELAWIRLVREVRRVGYWGTPRFEDPSIELAVKELFGGWRALCERLPADGPEFLGWAKQFKAIYGIYHRRASARLIDGSERFPRLASSATPTSRTGFAQFSDAVVPESDGAPR